MLVRFFRTPSLREPVRDYFAELPVSDRASFSDAISAIQEHGFSAPGIIFRQVKSKLWEFRVTGTISSRVFYFTIAGPEMVLLHAYKKQGQKAPPREIAVAERRMMEVLNET